MAVYKKREMVPGPFQNFVELIVEGLYNFFHTILGNDARRYTPFVGTLFLYILVMNWMGIVPFLKAPTSAAVIPISLALVVFVYAQGVGFKRLGPGGWLHHLAGEPRDVIGWALVPLMVPIHLIGEIAKPVSLGFRLFGNITGEDILVWAFAMMGVMALSFIGDLSPGIPLQVPFYFLGLLMSTIQALVFASLAAVYIALMLPHEHHEEKIPSES
jgi:F-type H+-transporting ATPase subunit a